MAQPSGFTPGVTEKLKFYVYLLIDPVNGEVFYLGKGTGDRCFAHLVEARQSKAKKSIEVDAGWPMSARKRQPGREVDALRPSLH